MHVIDVWAEVVALVLESIGVARGGPSGPSPPPSSWCKKISIVNCAHTICSLTDITLFSFYLNKTDMQITVILRRLIHTSADLGGPLHMLAEPSV